MEVNGVFLALIEVSLVFLLGIITRSNNHFKRLKNINIISFYWLLFTIITGIWEFSFLLNYNTTIINSQQLLDNKEHVWTNYYSLINLLPTKFSIIFYSEYGAYADREYMKPNDDWSRIIEGTHCIFCGLGALFAFLSLYSKYYNNIDSKYDLVNKSNKFNIYNRNYLIFSSGSMSAQAMNSILYIVNYFHETRDPYNINYNTTQFPTGLILNKRPFMYINILWTIMPLYVLYQLLI